jgi:membrane protease YdiL (CAAX protease family)
MSTEVTERTRTRRAWIALVAAPFVLGVSFAPFAAYLATTRGLSGDALARAMEPIAVFPGSIGFGAVFLMSRWLAKKDGLTLRALGWARPRVADVGIGLASGALFAFLNALVLHPWIVRAQPSFDPTLPNVSAPAVVALIAVAVVAEDTLYRGYAFTVLRRRHGALVAALVTTVFYALITPGQGFALVAWALGFGLVLAAIRLWRESLWPVVIPHALVGIAPKLLALVSDAAS